MSAYEDAQHVIERGRPEDLDRVLVECLESTTADCLGAVQLLAESMYGGMTYNYEMKMRAALCLVAWGPAGVEALVEAAQRTATSKNQSLALEILATLASEEPLPQASRWASGSVVEALRAAVRSWEPLYAASRPALRRFVLDLSEEDARLASGLAFIKSSVGDTEFATELARAFAARWLAVAEPVLAEYRQLLLEHPTEEALFQRFFTAHPSILEPDAMQIWPHPALQGIAEPDFIVRRRDDRYVIIELKTPDERIATAGGHLSAPVTRSIDQVRRYQDLMVGQIDRIQRHFPGFRQPDGLVVIGMEACMADRGRQALLRENAARTDVRVVGFDWLAERAEAINRNIIDAGVEVTRIRIE